MSFTLPFEYFDICLWHNYKYINTFTIKFKGTLSISLEKTFLCKLGEKCFIMDVFIIHWHKYYHESFIIHGDKVLYIMQWEWFILSMLSIKETNSFCLHLPFNYTWCNPIRWMTLFNHKLHEKGVLLSKELKADQKKERGQGM